MALNRPGGVQSYVLAIAPRLERLGHEVTLYAPDAGPIADLARERGLRVSAGEHELPAGCDAVLSNDAPTAYDMAERYPQVVLLGRGAMPTLYSNTAGGGPPFDHRTVAGAELVALA